MKSPFTSLDVRAMVAALQSTVGYRIANVYDINPKTYVLRLAKPDSKVLLLIESGIRIHTTAFARDKGQIPSGFSLKLRKHVRSKRIEKVEQFGTDRLICITCGSGPAEHHLIIELYDKGNVVLTDPEHKILTLLRNSKHDADVRVTVGDTYVCAPRLEALSVSLEELTQAMRGADEGTTARQLLMRLLPMGKEGTEHVLAAAALPASTKMGSHPWEDAALLGRLHAAVVEALGLFERAAREPPVGIIVLKDSKGAAAAAISGEDAAKDAAAGAAGAAEAAEQQFDDFSPFELAQHRGKALRRFDSFSEAVPGGHCACSARRALSRRGSARLAHGLGACSGGRLLLSARGAARGRGGGLAAVLRLEEGGPDSRDAGGARGAARGQGAGGRRQGPADRGPDGGGRRTARAAALRSRGRHGLDGA